jgi:NAD(P)-dependent dehydrogenase (short-subunit alcohol dehydrogenase family)
MASLEGKVVLVTGTTAGIGRATAILCAAEGATVIAAARRTDKGAETIAAIDKAGGSARFVTTDIGDEDSVNRLFALIEKDYGRLDGAVNNAAHQPPALELADTPLEVFDRAVAVNLRGTFMCMRHELRIMRAQRSGSVVNVSSTAGVIGILHSSTYTAGKHAIVGLTKSSALDMAPHQVRVNTVCPGGVRTEMFDQWAAAGGPERLQIMLNSNPMRRAADPKELAAAIVFLLSDAASFMTGHTMMVDGGMTAGAPAS